jgi:hypothetical protein
MDRVFNGFAVLLKTSEGLFEASTGVGWGRVSGFLCKIDVATALM